MVKNRGLAASLLSIGKEVLKMPVTAVALLPIEQEAVGPQSKMRPRGRGGAVGGEVRGPASALKRAERMPLLPTWLTAKSTLSPG